MSTRALEGRAQSGGIRHLRVDPGESTRNAFIARLDGELRDECPDQH